MEENNEENHSEQMPETNQTKECPFCGKQININAKKCKYCKNWIDEEIQCPYCFEKIKASAKKCRYCGEWLNKDKKEHNISKDSLIKINKKNILILIISVLLVLLLAVLLLVAYSYVPDCNNGITKAKLKEHIKTQYPVDNISYNSIVQNSKDEKGYTCTANITGYNNENNLNFSIKYNYKKAGLNTYNFTSEVILPDCYSAEIQSITADLIKKSKKLDFIDNVGDINFEYASVDKYDEKNKNYSCSADVVMKAKPGKALSLYWYNDSARKIVRCKVRYGSQFCENSITNCAQLFDVSLCKYDDGD